MPNTSTVLTDGKPLKVLLKYSLPFILATLLQAAYNITDIVFLGHFEGQKSAAAVGIGGQIVYLVCNAGLGIAAGATIAVAKFFGKTDKSGINNTISSLIVVFGVLSIILGGSMIFLTKPLLILLKTPSESLQLASIYVKISMLSLSISFAFNGIIAIIRGVGDSLFPLFIILIAFILNVAFDFLFITVFKLSVTGAAIATLISQAISGILSVFITIKNKKIGDQKFKFKLEKQNLKQLLKLGLPIALLNFTATLSFILLTFIVNALFKENRLEAASLHALASRFNGFAVLPSRAMASAIAVIVSQNCAKGLSKRNNSTLFYGISACVLFGLFVFCWLFFFPMSALNLLGANLDNAKIGKAYLMAMSFDYIILPIGVCAYGLVEGQGKTGISMLVNIIASLLIRIPAAYLLGKVFNLGITGIALSIPIASLSVVIMIWVYIIATKKLAAQNGRLNSNPN